MAEQESKKKEKKKIPTALKRIKQNKAKRTQHRAFKSRVKTATRAFKTAISEKDKESAQISLNQLYSLLDKGVKIRVYKKNKVARDKSRFAFMTKS